MASHEPNEHASGRVSDYISRMSNLPTPPPPFFPGYCPGEATTCFKLMTQAAFCIPHSAFRIPHSASWILRRGRKVGRSHVRDRLCVASRIEVRRFMD